MATQSVITMTRKNFKLWLVGAIVFGVIATLLVGFFVVPLGGNDRTAAETVSATRPDPSKLEYGYDNILVVQYDANADLIDYDYYTDVMIEEDWISDSRSIDLKMVKESGGGEYWFEKYTSGAGFSSVHIPSGLDVAQTIEAGGHAPELSYELDVNVSSDKSTIMKYYNAHNDDPDGTLHYDMMMAAGDELENDAEQFMSELTDEGFPYTVGEPSIETNDVVGISYSSGVSAKEFFEQTRTMQMQADIQYQFDYDFDCATYPVTLDFSQHLPLVAAHFGIDPESISVQTWQSSSGTYWEDLIVVTSAPSGLPCDVKVTELPL